MPKNLRTILIIIVVIIILGGLIYFLSSQKQQTIQIQEPIRIAFLGPLSGEVASWGQSGLAGAKLAVEEINYGGGVDGRKIELIVEDDFCSKDGINAWQKIVNVDKPVAIVGPVCSSVGGPALPIAQSAGIPVVITGASAPHLTKIGDYIFRIYPSDSFQGKFTAEYVFNKLGKRKVAVVYVKNDWGQGVRDVFVARFKELGGEIVFDEGVTQEEKDFRGLITKLKISSPEIVYLPLYPAGAVSFIKQLKEAGTNITMLGADALEAQEVIENEIADGVMYVVAKINNPEEFRVKVSSYAPAGLEINFMAPAYYDAIRILAEAIKVAGTDRTRIKEALKTIKYNGISNPAIEFDENGDIKSASYDVKIIRNKKVEKID
ncbi:MAG: ABC transporter substrate-binding protein [Patescibacteria group bacterium]|nr:ABC transporter substrate-binding protein [Patescibacteria group bacterium]